MSAILKPRHDEWQTPPELMSQLALEFHFTLDVAATAENAVCEAYITKEQNALIQGWHAPVVWCNPPYSLIKEFVARAYMQHWEQHNTIVLLIPAYTDPKYWWNYVLRADEIRFLKGRLAFLERGKKRTSARFPSVLVIYRWRPGASCKYPAIWWWDWRA